MNLSDYFRFHRQAELRIEQTAQDFVRHRDKLLRYNDIISSLNHAEYRTLCDLFQTIDESNISTLKTRIKPALVVCGSNSSGKSTFIHHFLGIDKILPTGTGPITARIVKMTYAPTENASVRIHRQIESIDESNFEEISLAQHFNNSLPWKCIAQDLKQHLERPTNIEPNSEAFIKWASCWVEVRIPSPILELGIDVYDTPGFLSQHREEFLIVNLSIMIQRISPTLIFLYDNPSITETDVNCFLELTKALRVVDQSKIFFLSTKADLKPIFDDRGIKTHPLTDIKFQNLLNEVRQQRYDFLRVQNAMGNESIGSLPENVDEYDAFDICSIPQNSRTPFQNHLKVMNEHCVKRIIHFISKNNLEPWMDLANLMSGIIELFFDFVRLMDYYNRPLTANLTDEAKDWSNTLIDLLRTELIKLAATMHDNILKQFDKVNTSIRRRVIERYKAAERISQPRIRDYIEEVANEEVIKVAVNETLMHALPTIQLINEHFLHKFGYGCNPLIDIVRRSVFDRITVTQVTKTTLIYLLTESFRKLGTKAPSKMNSQAQRMWKHVYAEYHASGIHIVGIDDENIFLVNDAERGHFAIEYFRLIKGKLIEQRTYHEASIEQWIEDKRTLSLGCIDKMLHQLKKTVQERLIIEKLLHYHVPDFTRIRCQLIATKHLIQLDGNRPQLGEQIHGSESYKIRKVQLNDRDDNLIAKQETGASQHDFHVEAYNHHRVTLLVPEDVIVPLYYLYEHPIENNTYALCMIMPTMKQTLHQYLQDNIAHLDWNTSINFAIQIAMSLSKLHRAKLAHGDLTSSSIFLDETNQCRLSNFGKTINSQYASTAFTVPPAVPELQEEALRLRVIHYDTLPVDIYSFGLILYELLPKDVYHSLNTENLFITSVPFALNTRVCWKIANSQLRELVLKCLQNDPKERPTIDGILTQLTDEKKIYEKSTMDVL